MDRLKIQRTKRFADEFRKKNAEYPTLKDFREAGYDQSTVDKAEKLGLLEIYHLKLSNGSVVKGYRPK